MFRSTFEVPLRAAALVAACAGLLGGLAIAAEPEAQKKTDKPAATAPAAKPAEKPATPPAAAPAAEPAPPKKTVYPDVLAKIGDTAITKKDAFDYIVSEVQKRQMQQLLPLTTVLTELVADGKITKDSGFDYVMSGLVSGQPSQADETIQGVIDQLVANRLIDQAASKEGKTGEAWMQEQVDKKAAEPTDQEIQSVYDQAKAQLGNQPLEQVKPQIVRYLKGQQGQKVYQEVVDDLRAKSNVKVLVEPSRAQVSDAGRPARGPAGAPVTIVEFSDYQCPFCSRAEQTVKQVRDTYGDKVRVVFRDFPLSFHQNAEKSAEAAGCALEQGKFWEMHDKLFDNQNALTVPDLKKYAGELKLDQKKFDECLDSGRRTAQIKEDQAAGSAVGVTGTPGFFINGRSLGGAVPFDQFAKVIDDELTRKGIAIPPKPKPAAPAAQAAKPATGAPPAPNAKPATPPKPAAKQPVNAPKK